MRLFGNVIWLVFGGLVMGLAWWLGGAVIAITIIGIPFSVAAFRIGVLSFWPFGREVVDRPSRSETRSILELIGNVVWIVLCGLWLALGHLIWALLLAISVIGIPFALQHVKLAKLSLMPFGKDIVVKPT